MCVIFNLSTRVAALWAFEIKLISTPGKEDLDRLNKTADRSGLGDVLNY